MGMSRKHYVKTTEILKSARTKLKSGHITPEDTMEYMENMLSHMFFEDNNRFDRETFREAANLRT